MTPNEAVRTLIAQRLDELGLDMSEVSRRIGRNHAYVQQFLKRGVPSKLPEDVRAQLASVLHLDESELKPGVALGRALLPVRNVSDPAALSKEKPKPKPSAGREVSIPELDVRAVGGGDGGVSDLMDVMGVQERTVANWSVPSAILRAQTSAPTDRIRIITVYGNSMSPDFNPGDRIMVDVDDRIPSPPGVFAIWDGFGLVIKYAEMVPYSDPPMVNLISRNDTFPPRQLLLEDIRINGRVIGKWTWT